jgi:hypothetical protein
MKAILRAKDVYDAARITYNSIVQKRADMAKDWVDAKREAHEHGFFWRHVNPRDDAYWEATFEHYMQLPRIADLHANQKKAALVIVAITEAVLDRDPEGTIEVDFDSMAYIEYGFTEMRKRKGGYTILPDDEGKVVETKTGDDGPPGSHASGPTTPLPPVTGLLKTGKPLI